jgi:hypothetical protein
MPRSGLSRQAFTIGECLAQPVLVQIRRGSKSKRLTLCACLALGLSGCHNGDTSSPAPATPAPVPSPNPSQPSVSSYPHGHFRGTAAVGDKIYQYHAEAILTVDGELRLYVGGPTDVTDIESGAGTGDLSRALAMSVQLVGHVSPGQPEGSGVIVGQSCSPTSFGRFCALPAPANIVLTILDPGTLKGELHVAAAGADEVWSFDLSYWSAYYGRWDYRGALVVPEPNKFLVPPNGTYREQLAEFAHGDDVIITIDKNGLLFFQAPKSGCTGNGRLTPHFDASYYVFDVALLIENCDASHEFLNGELKGLATDTEGNIWAEDDWLVMLLSGPEGAPSRAAVTMISAAIY